MKTPLPHQWVVSLRLTLSALAVTALGTVAMSSWAQGMHGGRVDAAMGGRAVERMLDRIHASADQRTQIKQITDRARAGAQAQRAEHLAARDAMVQAFTQPVVDANALEAQRQQVMRFHESQSRRMMQMLVEISRVLTPEQRQQLADYWTKRRDMRARHLFERQSLESKPTSR